MGNGYNHHLHQQSFYNKNLFLPLLCRVSIKDVQLREYKERSSSFSDDPSSPKVSCMGQVKKSNRLIGFSTPYRLKATATAAPCAATTTTFTSKTTTSHQGSFKYSKLKRLFSGKNLMTSSLSTATTKNTIYGGNRDGIRSCREIIMRRNGSRRSSKINNDDGGGGSCHSSCNDYNIDVNIGELDPPLPVVKKVQQPCEVNLWKRRSGGPALKSLQIEQIHVHLSTIICQQQLYDQGGEPNFWSTVVQKF